MMRKKYLQLVSLCVGLLTLMPSASLAALADESDGDMLGMDFSGMIVWNGSQFSYRNESDDTVSIVGCASDMTGVVEIPETIGNKPVATISEGAFYEITGMTGIVLPDSVISVESGAFYGCTALESVTLSKSLHNLGESAFYGCTALTAIDIPDTVMGIPASCFSGCSALQDFQLPESLISIGESAFYGTIGPDVLEFPPDLNTIEGTAFAYCTGIQSVHLTKEIVTLGDYVFDGCSALQSITVDKDNTAFCDMDGVLFDKSLRTLLKYPAAKANSDYTVPAGVSDIAAWAFVGASNLHSIDLNNVTGFGEETFYACEALESFTIPEGMTEIPSAAFANCTSLKEITIPAHCTKLGEHAFLDCTSLKEMTIPETVTVMEPFCVGFHYNEETQSLEQMKHFTLNVKAGSPAATYAQNNKLSYHTGNEAFIGIIVAIVVAVCAVIALIAYLIHRRNSVVRIGAGPNKGQIVSQKKHSSKGDSSNAK